MRLPFLRAKPAPAEKRSRRSAAVDEAASVDAARTRARRRLVGALVLLLVGIIGFPMFFETQPRPLPLDIPMSIQRRDGNAATPALPATSSDAAVASARRAITAPTQDDEVVMAPTMPTPAAAPPATAQSDDAAPARPATASASSPAAAPATPASKPAAVAPTVVASPTPAAVKPAPPPPPARETAPPAAAAPAEVGRFVVQVGAFSDAGALRDVRSKVEKLGLKTYTQQVQTSGGARTRVRLGPFTTRDEADAAAARVKRAGLPANILAL